MDIDLRNDWDRAPDATKFSIEAAVNLGVPVDALAFYARWWQLETWLRQLVYLEFRAKWGIDWTDHLVPAKFRRKGRNTTAVNRATKDSANTYMATPDSTNVVSYMDVSIL